MGVGSLPILAANVLPLVGVLWFGWDPETLVAVGGVVVVATPVGPSVSWVLLPVALPFLGVVPMGRWKLAHP